MKELETLRWIPRWTSHVGCIKGCLDYLGIQVSDAWLFGATGHAFLLNVKDDLCASGPTDWDTDRFLELGRNIGYLVEGVDAYCAEPESVRHLQAQQQAWDYVRSRIDDGLPCYGWEFDVPEFYVIYGYDDTGYFISGPGCDEGKGPIPWQGLGCSEIGVVAVLGIRPVDPADEGRTVRDALSYALDHGRGKRGEMCCGGHGGLNGYDTWIHAMEEGSARTFGLAYNAVVWAECRKFAVGFLAEARERLGPDLGPLLRRAAECYETVSRNLEIVSDTYPFSPELDAHPIEVDERARSTAAALRRARDAEAAGLDTLAELMERMPA